MPEINAGDTAWVLMSAALVMLMTPGLALFYGGLVRRKNVLSTIMHSFFRTPGWDSSAASTGLRSRGSPANPLTCTPRPSPTSPSWRSR